MGGGFCTTRQVGLGGHSVGGGPVLHSLYSGGWAIRFPAPWEAAHLLPESLGDFSGQVWVITSRFPGSGDTILPYHITSWVPHSPI